MLIINHMYNIKEIQIYNRIIHKVNLIGEQNPYFGWNMKGDANQMKEKCTSYCKTSCEIAFTTMLEVKIVSSWSSFFPHVITTHIY